MNDNVKKKIDLYKLRQRTEISTKSVLDWLI